MGVGGKAARGRKLLAKMVQPRRIDAPFDISPRIRSGRCVALEINHICESIVVASTKEMIETDLVQSRGRSVSGYMAAANGMEAIGFHNHRHSVPAHEAFDACLVLSIVWIGGLFFRRLLIHIVGIEGARDL